MSSPEPVAAPPIDQEAAVHYRSFEMPCLLVHIHRAKQLYQEIFVGEVFRRIERQFCDLNQSGCHGCIHRLSKASDNHLCMHFGKGRIQFWFFRDGEQYVHEAMDGIDGYRMRLLFRNGLLQVGLAAAFEGCHPSWFQACRFKWFSKIYAMLMEEGKVDRCTGLYPYRCTENDPDTLEELIEWHRDIGRFDGEGTEKEAVPKEPAVVDQKPPQLKRQGAVIGYCI